MTPVCGAVFEHKRILLAEDDHEFRCLLADTLSNDGYAIEAVGDGKVLLDRIMGAASNGGSLCGIDLILSDIRLSNCDAFEIMKGMRDANIAVPILLMTAFGDQRTHERAAQLGALGVMDKPFELDDLRMVVWHVLRD
jgi:DNA-binding response OmpR family regulator